MEQRGREKMDVFILKRICARLNLQAESSLSKQKTMGLPVGTGRFPILWNKFMLETASDEDRHVYELDPESAVTTIIFCF